MVTEPLALTVVQFITINRTLYTPYTPIGDSLIISSFLDNFLDEDTFTVLTVPDMHGKPHQFMEFGRSRHEGLLKKVEDLYTRRSKLRHECRDATYRSELKDMLGLMKILKNVKAVRTGLQSIGVRLIVSGI